MDGLSEKIQEILTRHSNSVSRYMQQDEELRQRLKFCKEHNFEHESYVTGKIWSELTMIIDSYKNLFDEIKEANDDWNS